MTPYRRRLKAVVAERGGFDERCPLVGALLVVRGVHRDARDVREEPRVAPSAVPAPRTPAQVVASAKTKPVLTNDEDWEQF